MAASLTRIFTNYWGTSTTRIIATVFAALPILPSLVGILVGPDAGMAAAGLGQTTTRSGHAFYLSNAALQIGFAVLALQLLYGRAILPAIGTVAALETIFMVDCVLGRKWNVGVAPAVSN